MPNLITAPRFWKNKALLLKAEATVGTDAIPTGAANWIEARNVSFTPMDAQTADRNIEQPYFGSGGKVQVSQYVKVGFEVAVAGSGTAGTAPKIAPALLACAFAETVSAGVSVAYNLISTAIGACSLYCNIDGTLHKLIGARGTVGVSISAGGLPMFKFEFDAVFTDPTAVALPSVTRTGWQVEQAVNATNTGKVTLNAVDLAWSALDVSVGNQLARIDLPGPQREVAITDRKPTAGITVLAPALAAFDPFALAKAGTAVTLSATHGSAAGKKVQVDVKGLISGADYDQIEGMLAYKLTIEPTPVAGNDELAFTFL